MNPLIILWDGSLLFVGFVFGVVLFPLTLFIAGPVGALLLFTRLGRRRREARYSWAVPLAKVNKSGYRRRRYGRWS